MRRFALTLLLLLFVALPAAAQSAAMIERVESTLAALSGTPEQFETYAGEAFAEPYFDSMTPEQRRALYTRIREAFGAPIAAEGLLRVAPGRVKVIVSGPNKSGALLLDHEGPEPHRVLALAIAGDAAAPPAPPPAQSRNERPTAALPPVPVHSRMDASQLAASLDPYLQQLTKEDRFSGAVLVARDGKPLFARGYGLANRSDNVPNTAATRFNVGSINKQFTRVALAQLAAAGKLMLDDPIGRHLPDYPVEAAKKATIQQMITHRGGVRDWGDGDDFVRNSKSLYRTNRDFYRLVSVKPLEFEPGSQEQYCNACYVVLGEIVERLAGMPYERYVEQNVLARAGMTDAGFFQSDDPRPRVAIGYTRVGNSALRTNLHFRGAGPNAAGGAFATPADLLAFDNALRDGKLLDAKWTAWFFNQKDPVTGRVSGELTLGGGANGVSSMLRSNGAWTVVAMANLDTPAGSSVARAVFEAIAK